MWEVNYRSVVMHIKRINSLSECVDGTKASQEKQFKKYRIMNRLWWLTRVKLSIYLLIYVKWLKSCDVLAFYLHYAVLHILTKMVTNFSHLVHLLIYVIALFKYLKMIESNDDLYLKVQKYKSDRILVFCMCISLFLYLEIQKTCVWTGFFFFINWCKVICNK